MLLLFLLLLLLLAFHTVPFLLLLLTVSNSFLFCLPMKRKKRRRRVAFLSFFFVSSRPVGQRQQLNAFLFNPRRKKLGGAAEELASSSFSVLFLNCPSTLAVHQPSAGADAARRPADVPRRKLYSCTSDVFTLGKKRSFCSERREAVCERYGRVFCSKNWT